MSSGKDAKLLDDSTKESSYGAIPKQIFTQPKRKIEIQNPDYCSSAPAVLEPSKDAYRPPKRHKQTTTEDSNSPPINPWRTLVTCSYPQSSTRNPLSADDERNDRANEQQNVPEETDDPSTTYSSFLHRCVNLAIKLKSSKLIYVFQVLFFSIPISGVIMGILFNKNCPESHLLPTFSGITGVIGMIFTCLWMSMTRYYRRDQQISFEHKFAFAMFFSALCTFTIIEMCIVGMMTTSFDQRASNYCNKTFYYWSHYKPIAIGVVAVLALVLYLPDSLRYLLCHCFSTPANEFEQ